jgi:serine/threonine protein kinase/tetratricopeptide (TPR) repeat protein
MSERDLFIAALKLTEPAERAAWLDRECAGDAALRQRIDVLLQAFDKAGSLLEKPVVAIGLTTDEPITESPGTVIGPYKLLEQIGEGGFGVVFMAEQQQPIRRRVALKVLKPGMDTRQVVARFEVERQALALMDHPHIAKVLDGGETATGRPYFVMDLVKGLPITEYCDQNQLTPRQRLELFLPVCQAVQHAHQKGVIHRDLKPSNVVVSQDEGVPCAKVIDFGIAKSMGQQLTDKTLFTGFAQLIGTPLYMSPEQAAGGPDIDTRSDIYSLGVLLYELLTGTTPFDKERLRTMGYDEIRRVIREEEPPKPSTRISTLGQAAPTVCTNRKSDPKRLSQLMRGELDWIVMKALEKDRNRRYETASAFAADVQRYLHDEPVQACPPSAWYKFRKFARRNKRALAVAGLILFFMVLLCLGAGWYQQERAARGVALAARQRETERAVTAALTQAKTLVAEGDKQTDYPEHWQATARLALAALEKAEELLAAGVGTEELVERVRQVRMSVNAAVADSRLLVELDRIRLEEAAVNVKESRFDSARAAPLYAEVLRDYGVDPAAPQAAAARVSNSRLRDALLAALENWSRVTPDAAERQRVQKVCQAALTPDDFRTRWRAAALQGDTAALVKLSREAPVQRLPATTISNLAKNLTDVKEWVAAEQLLRAGLQRKPGDFWLNEELGLLLLKQPPQRAEQAVRYLTAALALRSDSPGVHLNLGNALHDTGDRVSAIHCYQSALDIDPKYVMAHINLGNVLYDKGDPVGAIRSYQSALQIDASNTQARFGLAIALHEKADLQQAVREYRAVLEIDPEYAEAHCNLGHALISQGHFQQAVEELRRGHELGARKPDWFYPSGEWLPIAERLTQLEPRLPGLLKGETRAADSAERLALALFAYCKQLYAAAARFYGEALVADPKLGENLAIGCRSAAAGAAARAGCGRGQDGAELSGNERARLRGQALNWLRADLEAWSKLLSAGGAKSAPAVQAQMRRWLRGTDFAGLRGLDTLAKLPDTERAHWQKLWADVDNLLKEAALANQPLETLDRKLRLAVRYDTQGNYNEAETLYQEVLRAAEQLGADLPLTLSCKECLAHLYYFQSKYALAETLYQDVLQRRTAKLGPAHFNTLITKSGLARVYTAQGKYDRAEPILQEVIKAQTANCGAHHLTTLSSKENLASLYKDLKKYDRAEILLQDVVQAKTAQLGADHPDTLIVKHNLAILYFDQGKDDRAEQLLQEVLQAHKTTLPPDHPGILSAKKSLGSVYLNQGKYDQAEPLMREVLQARTAKLGADHDATLNSKHGLARLYYAQGQYAKGEPLFLETIDGMQKTLGIGHPETQYYIHNLALCYQRMKRPNKAEQILRELVAYAKQHTGTDSPQYASHLAALGLPLLDQNRPAEAEKVLRESLAISEKKKSESWRTFNARSILGGALLAQKKYADAEPFLLQGYQGMKEREAKIRRMDRVALTETLERLVQLYDAWGKTDKADQWRNKLQTERRSK